MADGAPVCNLPNQGQVPALQAGVRLLVPARPTDLPSLLRAINMLADLIPHLAQPNSPAFRNNLAPTNGAGDGGGTTEMLHMGAGPNGKDGKDGKTKPITFKETKRTTRKVKIFAENSDGTKDEDAYIIVERVTRLEYTDEKTQSKLVWVR